MNEGPSDDTPDEPSAWEPVETGPDEGPDPEELERREEELDRREEELKQQKEKLDDREDELDEWEQEILERREENVEKREELDARKEDLDETQERLQNREEALNEREDELDDREEEIDTKREALEEYASSGRTFTKRPRIAGGVMLWVVALASAALAAWSFLYAGQGGLILQQPLVEPQNAKILAGVLGLVTIVEVAGGYLAYKGERWYFSVLAGILGIVVLLPVGITATIMITVGESQFS